MIGSIQMEKPAQNSSDYSSATGERKISILLEYVDDVVAVLDKKGHMVK